MTARAAGLPVLGFVSAAHGVRSLDGTRRYVAVPGRRDTIVKAIAGSAGTLGRVIPGRFGVPVVAYDGSAGGLSANGRTLVLIRPRQRFPQRSTDLAVLEAGTLRVLRSESLHGDFAFDAISPTGEWVYLIQYTSGSDPTRYRVRALSTRTGKLIARDIVDPHDRGETMRGNALSRVSSADGRWAYTLYDGNGHPFVHALDTSRRRARCIEVAEFPSNADVFAARVRLAGQRLMVVLAGRTLSEIDTRSLKVLAPIAHHSARPPTARATITIGLPIALAVLLLTGVIFAVRRLR